MRIIFILIEELAEHLIVRSARQFVINCADRFDHLVDMVEVAVVGYHSFRVEHGRIHHVETIAKMVGIPCAAREEIVVVGGCIES